ncbi:MAG: LCP family protein [Lachnospiraceae bacterium]|nr:LCP family protein [Lachnospiraceae bacterium]
MSNKKKIVLKGIIAAVLLILMFVVIIVDKVNKRMNMINREFATVTVSPEDEVFDDDSEEFEEDYLWILNTMTPEETAVPLGSTISPDKTKAPNKTYAPKWPEDIETYKDSNVNNILLIGEDLSEDGSSRRSDSMILISIDKNNKAVKLTSFLRDSYVQIPGYSDNKLNSAYAFGGVNLLNKTIEKNFAVSIDHNVVIDFNDFMKIIDILGGVTINITEKEAKYLRGYGHDVYAGSVDMDGYTALDYSRIRKIDSDFYRTARQRTVFTTVFNKVKDKSLVELYDISDDIFPYITTDMSNGEILECIRYIKSINLEELETFRVPVDGSYSNGRVRKMQVLNIDLTKNRNALRDFLY